MRPLTDHTPKPLLSVGGKPLIHWHLERLAAAGCTDVAINHAWLGERIVESLGHGEHWGLRLHYSAESPALETAGGIRQALPLLGAAPFLVINGDVWCDWPPQAAMQAAARLSEHGTLAWLLLVDNPEHHPAGDFCLQPETGLVLDQAEGGRRLTFSGIGVYHPALFSTLPAGQPAPLAPVLRQAMAQRQVLGETHTGRWTDVGTPARLSALDAELRGSASLTACTTLSGPADRPQASAAGPALPPGLAH